MSAAEEQNVDASETPGQTPLFSDSAAASEDATEAVGVVKKPEFMPLQDRSVPGAGTAMERFYDVRVPVWAELGRVEMQLGDLLQLGEGSVLRLNRPVGEPVDLVSQGVKLARGEVVVVEDSFAIRIREILSTEK